MAPKTVSAINENWTQNSTSESPRKLREANSPSSTSGLRWRRSIRTNPTRSSNPPPGNTSTDADPQPQVLDCISASTTAAKPGTSVASPAQSSRWPRSTCPGGRVHSTIAMVAAATGRFTQKTQRQSAYSVNSPPTSGPSDSASIDTPAYTPIAFPRSSGGKVLITIAPVGGIISAAPAPWTARARRMASSSSARPQAAEASAKSEIPTISTATLLNMSASRPPTATSAASASRYALTTHCSSVCVRSSSRWIDGNAKLTNVASSILSASLAYVVGPLAGGKLADPSLVGWFDYATPYWAVTILLVGVLIAVAAWFPETSRGAPADVRYLDAFTNLARVITDRRLRPFYLVNFVLYVAIFGFFRVYPMYLVDEFDLGVGRVSEFIAYVAVPIVIANVWLVGALSRRLRPRTMVVGSALATGAFMALIVVPSSEISLWFTLGPTAAALAVCLPSCAAMLSLAADDREQGRAMGNNQSMQVGAESLSGLAGGALAAIVIKLPLLVFAGAAIVGGLTLVPRHRREPLASRR